MKIKSSEKTRTRGKIRFALLVLPVLLLGACTSQPADAVTIDGRKFTKRTWYDGETPIFIAYLPADIIPDFELLFAWVGEANEADCFQTLDTIISSIEFSQKTKGG